MASLNPLTSSIIKICNNWLPQCAQEIVNLCCQQVQKLHIVDNLSIIHWRQSKIRAGNYYSSGANTGDWLHQNFKGHWRQSIGIDVIGTCIPNLNMLCSSEVKFLQCWAIQRGPLCLVALPGLLGTLKATKGGWTGDALVKQSREVEEWSPFSYWDFAWCLLLWAMTLWKTKT